ncbi:hypothetical protein [Gemella sanguinis]|uniref:Uncharacterized protein n=1 Tax=Gemella sanguinis TaxID=84135 RepID=A0A2N6SGW1_9BACL|nr:hypothetical protein [Gemella sanguinis]PMC53167.1 hypothetical protein CJ218_01095 [Gemella sanguinis]
MTQCKKCKNNFIEEILSFKYEDDKKIITHFLSKKSKNSDEEYELKKAENNYYNIYPEPDLNFGPEPDSEEVKPFKVIDEIEIEDVKDKLKINGWEVTLETEPNYVFYEEFIEKWDYKTTYFHRTNDIHRGHLLAKAFKKYLIPLNLLDPDSDEKHKIDAYFGKGCSENITYQSKDGNCTSDKKNGQLFFENRIIKFFEKNPEEKVKFKIYNLSLAERSLGRVLIIEGEYKNKNENNVESINYKVFIPNSY